MKAERMTKSDKSNRQSVIAAAVAASLLIAVFGLTYRVLAARLEGPVDSTPINPAVMARFPMEIGGWMGQEVPLDEAIVRATDTDAHINRRYSRHNGMESVALYVACGVKARDLMPHRPEVCYTGAGWTLTNRRSVEMPLDGGMRLPCNVLQFSRGALNTQRVVVLDYYVVDGEYCQDVSLLRSKAWRGSGTVRYVAQVQVVAPVTETLVADSATRLVCAFAVDSASSIARLFEETEKGPASE
jgi:EpsI family protein